jgi:hypothetical protein
MFNHRNRLAYMLIYLGVGQDLSNIRSDRSGKSVTPPAKWVIERSSTKGKLDKSLTMAGYRKQRTEFAASSQFVQWNAV